MKHKVSLLFLIFLLMSPKSYAAPECHLKRLVPLGHEAVAGPVAFELGDPNDAVHPTAWAGPIVISAEHRKSCTVSGDVSVIAEPIALTEDRRFLYVSTYSGSENSIYIVSVGDCSIQWRSKVFERPPFFSVNGLVLQGDRLLRIGADCLPDQRD